jgi:hypothetical protein
MDATSAANQYLNAGRYDDLSTLGGKYIRLLGIDTASSHMKCTLRTVNLDERPQYTALSYVWGDLSDIRFIECNGSPLSITKNLDVALQHPWTRPGSFWIHAICIYVYQHRKKPFRNLRFGPPFSEGFFFNSD